ncbi:GNAT family N-acetyltransferase [Aquimarina pacifica]|uniref:GNAT family N-acetyltransferase n=1 Tax=Aquimarina pacifica TaxID=1296415 RepID=UPI0004715DF7|nr:GNAT family N-acetyltransferase [Aquimarina pacifica]
MKSKQHLIKLNIQNLTSLWKEASIYNNSFVENNLFKYAAIENRNWPNRLWFSNTPEQDTLLLAKDKVFSKFPDLIIPYWDIPEHDLTPLFKQNGFVTLFEQIGMSLKTNSLFEEKKEVSITRVSTKSDSILWSTLFKLSFGYEIHPNILTNTHRKINFYIAYHKGKSIGTAITYQTNTVTGIHGVGIIPNGRRKGIANELMKILINISIRKKSKYITLQASDMGKGLYIKLGFEEQFLIKNYALQQRR